MPYAIGWQTKERIILERVYGDVDVENTLAAAQTITQLIEAGTAPAHLIVDAREVKAFPANLTKLSVAAQFLRSPKFGWSVIIGDNSLAKFMVAF